LNPADSLSKRSDYKAQEKPSLVQKDILASKLVESNPGLSKTARLNSELYNTVVAQEELTSTQKDLCNIVKCQLCKASKLKLDIVAESKLIDLPETELCNIAKTT
jgi:hypothetical protein